MVDLVVFRCQMNNRFRVYFWHVPLWVLEFVPQCEVFTQNMSIVTLRQINQWYGYHTKHLAIHEFNVELNKPKCKLKSSLYLAKQRIVFAKNNHGCSTLDASYIILEIYMVSSLSATSASCITHVSTHPFHVEFHLFFHATYTFACIMQHYFTWGILCCYNSYTTSIFWFMFLSHASAS